jgi:hypothetical protein
MQLRSKCLSSKPMRYFGLAVPVMAVFFVSSLFAQPIMRWDSAGVGLRVGTDIFWNRAVAQDPVTGDMVVAWSDCRTGDRDIYAQKFNLNGVPQWGDSGICIVHAISHQQDPEVMYSGDGNWIIAWRDWRLTLEGLDLDGDIFAQKVNSNGDPLWTPEGVAICTAEHAQQNIQLVSDTTGGVIIIWEDYRVAGYYSQVYAQHVISNGQIDPNWLPNGYQVISYQGSQSEITADTDGRGGAIVAWHDTRTSMNPDIYAQRITSQGTLLWNANGQPICTFSGNQYYPQLCADGQGGAYVVWQDYRTNPDLGDLYFQRIDSSGNLYYESDGRVLCDAAMEQSDCHVIASGDSGAIFCWTDYRNDPYNCFGDIYAQKVNASGVTEWGANGLVVCSADECQLYPTMISDGEGGAIIGWADDRITGNGDYDIYAQRISSVGTPLWSTNGVAICDADNWQSYVTLTSDLEHGAYFFWSDTRTGSTGLYEQHLNSNGISQQHSNGQMIHYGISGDAFRPKMVPTVPGKILVAWLDSRYGQCNLFIQLLDSSGNTYLEPNGRLVCTNSVYWGETIFQLSSDLQHGGLLVWSDVRNEFHQIYAQRIDPQGNILWTEGGVHVHSIEAGQMNPCVAGDGTGGAFVIWSEETINQYIHMFAQRLNASGVQVWNQPVDLFPGSEYWDDYPNAVPDGENGVIVVWQTGPWPEFYILAQKLDQNGNELWQSGGIRVSNSSDWQNYPIAIGDGAGGAIIAWNDYRDLQFYGLFVQRIDCHGDLVWSDSGLSLCDVPSDKQDTKLALDCDGNVFVVWADYRSHEDMDIYLQKISPSGTLLFSNEGLPVSVLEGDQYKPEIVSDIGDGVYVTWEDRRGTWPHCDIYCSHINGAGELAGPEGLWQPNGNIVCDALFYRMYPTIAPDGAGGCMIAWEDARALSIGGPEPNLYAQRMNDGTITSGVGDGIASVPTEFRLEQNYPNPFNPSTRISYSLAHAGNVRLVIYDILGRKVRTLQNQFMTAGSHYVIWNGEASSGVQVASGTYFYKLQVPGNSQVQKMVLIK